MSEDFSLIGDDCKLFTGDPGTEKTGDGTKTLDELAGGAAASGKGKGYWFITAIAASGSFFPTGAKPGMIIPAAGTEVLATGDKAAFLGLTHIADASGWQMNISRNEVDVTKLHDEYRHYRFGKRDAQMTINNILTLGVTDKEGGMIEKTMTVFRKAADNSITITEIDDKPIYFLGFVRQTNVPGETQAFVFARVALSGMTLGAAIGAAQSYDTSARLQSDPVFYTEEIA